MGREAKGLSKGRYDKTFAGEDDVIHVIRKLTFTFSLVISATGYVH